MNPLESAGPTIPTDRVRALAVTLLHLCERADLTDGQVLASSIEYALCRWEIPLPSLSEDQS